MKSEIYKKSLRKKWYIKINTKHPDGDAYCGIVLTETRTFVVIAEYSEIEYDGIAVIPKKYIKSVRDGKNEKCLNEILRFNGQIKKAKAPKWLMSCETVQSIIAELMKRDIWPSVEMISEDGKNSAMYLGAIVGHDNETLFGQYAYSSDGKWEKEYILPFSGIFKIDLNDRYTKHFNKYMRSKTKTFPWETKKFKKA